MTIYYEDDKIQIRSFSSAEHEQIYQIKKQKSIEAIEKNIPQRKEKRRLYMAKKLKEDPLFKLRHNIRNLIRNSVNRRGFNKNTKTYQILGCTVDIFKNHIEMQFTEGMSWDNYGKWEYDHIVPMSSAKDEKTVLELNHYTNFQPLWKKDNITKGAKIS